MKKQLLVFWTLLAVAPGGVHAEMMLNVTSDTRATLLVDGEKKGETPIAVLIDSPGLHKVTVQTDPGQNRFRFVQGGLSYTTEFRGGERTSGAYRSYVIGVPDGKTVTRDLHVYFEGRPATNRPTRATTLGAPVVGNSGLDDIATQTLGLPPGLEIRSYAE